MLLFVDNFRLYGCRVIFFLLFILSLVFRLWGWFSIGFYYFYIILFYFWRFIMAFTTPSTASPGGAVTAALWNSDVRDNTNAINDALKNVQGSISTVNTPSTTSATLADITGMSTTITPSSATSRVLVMVAMNVGSNGSSAEGYFNLVRNSTAISIGTTGSSNYSAVIRFDAYSSTTIIPFSIVFIDSPATTSATTYKMQWGVNSGTIYLNRRVDVTFSTASSIIAMEIKA